LFENTQSYLNKIKKIIEKKSIECLSSIYINAHTKMDFRCLICDWEWSTKPNNIQQKNGCPKCGNSVKYKENEINKKLSKKNIKLISPYKGMKYYHDWECLICGNEWKGLASNICHRSGCPECSQLKRIKNFKETIRKKKSK
jgi:hypothetical protein